MLSSDEVRPNNQLKSKYIDRVKNMGEKLKKLIIKMPSKDKKNVETKFRH